jgi:putative flippase GtrA
MTKRFLAFLVAGGLAAVANFGSRIALGHVLGYATSILVAYSIGKSTAFLLNRVMVFRSPTNSLRNQAAWFVAINIAAVVQTLVVSLVFARCVFPSVGFAHHPETVAHAIGVAVPVVTSYFGHKYLTFRGTH